MRVVELDGDVVRQGVERLPGGERCTMSYSDAETKNTAT